MDFETVGWRGPGERRYVLTPTCRLEIGAHGGIDALFILTDKEDQTVQANALWALSNLSWSTSNQERIGFHMQALVKLCLSENVAVRGNATAALANSLFYNENNRRRLADVWVEQVRKTEGDDEQEHVDKGLTGLDVTIALLSDENVFCHENAARALGTACHNGKIAGLAGRKGAIPKLIGLCGSKEPEVQRYATFGESVLLWKA